MNLYQRDYIKKPPTEEEIKEYNSIQIQETQEGLPVGKRNLYYLYPPAIRHYNSLFPNNHIELLDYRDNDKEIGLKQEYNELIENFGEIIHNSETTERDILKFINHKPAFFIPASISETCGVRIGHHDLYLFPEFSLGSKNAPKPDYMLIGHKSGGYEFILIELEKSNGRTTIKNGYQGEAYRKADNQIKDWKAWIDENSSTFFQKLSSYSNKQDLPKELKSYDSSRFHYVSVAGLRDDYSDVTYRERRNKLRNENVYLLHYDNLYDSAVALNERKTF